MSDTMNATEISVLWGVHRAQVTRARTDLGEPVSVGGRPQWTRERVVLVGRMRGYLDEQGRPVERLKKAPAPYPHPDETGQIRVYGPDAAAVLGITTNLLYTWNHRGKMGAPDGIDGRLPWWYMTTLRKIAKREQCTFDPKARRPQDQP